MSVIAKSVVMKPALLNGEEIRFLRKRIGKRAADFADLINKTPEHFSKLENDQVPLQEDTDKLIRMMYGMLSGDKKLLLEIMSRVEDWLRSIRGREERQIRLKKQAGTWKPLPRAA
jgi:transcriptional regulator with XRE-family HTH domain